MVHVFEVLLLVRSIPKLSSFSETNSVLATAVRLVRRVDDTVELADAPVPTSDEPTNRQSSVILRLCHRCFARMDAGHRAIFVWTLLLFVLIFLVVYLDGGLDHETLIFFSLLWFFDFLSLAEVVAGIIRHYRVLREHTERFQNLRQDQDVPPPQLPSFETRKTAISTVLLILKTIFELCLYGHLRFGCLSLLWVMIPLWLFLTIVIGQLSVYIVQIHQKSVSEESR